MGSDGTNTIVKLGVLGLAGYLLYQWLQNSGLWGQMFGFSTTQQLITYCQANPSGSASYGGQSAPCSQWLAAVSAAQTTPSTTPTASTAPTTPPVQTSAPATLTTQEQQLATSLQNAAVQSSNTPPLTVSQWNYIMNNLTNPGSSAAQLPQFGNALIDAPTYVAARASGGFGLSGFIPARFMKPYRWVN